MPSPLPFPIRVECPPGACNCNREALLADPDADIRVLRLTREEEKKLIARIERISSYEDLKHVARLIEANLGIELRIAPGPNEVRTVRGFVIQLAERPGLCRKVRQSIPAAVRRCLDEKPEIAYAILDAHDLLGGGMVEDAGGAAEPAGRTG
ncbi:MAG TPA: hypothetical protein VM406_10355 [Noviherbaspirillum sp.]|nr:hypothetical protein [Noviherbaspirillum sp.]